MVALRDGGSPRPLWFGVRSSRPAGVYAADGDRRLGGGGGTSFRGGSSGESAADHSVLVDAAGEVLAVGAWPWGITPTVGESFALAFASESRPSIRVLMGRAWIGVSERTFPLVAGPEVGLTACADAAGFRIAVQDATARQLVAREAERRRRMGALAEFAASLARELTDPMSIVQGRLELLHELGVADPAMVQRHLSIALEHARRVTATLHNLRMVGRTAGPSRNAVSVADAVQDALELVGAKREQVIVRIRPEGLRVGADGAVLARVVAAFVRQSLEALGRGTVEVRGQREKERVRLRIGPPGRSSGRPVEDATFVLERTLIVSLGGDVSAKRAGSALRFDLDLPGEPTRPSRRRPVRGRLLFVGGDLVRDGLITLLERDGYEFITAKTGEEAFGMLRHEPVDGVVSELLLDGDMSGLGLAELVLASSTEAPRFLLLSDEALPRPLPPPLVSLTWPLSRSAVLDAMGTRQRRSQ